jgi:membrane protein DedA with SNARE-associated domain
MIKRSYKQRVLSILYGSNLESARLWLITGVFIWAAILSYPGDTFNGPQYKVMMHFANEEVWACLFSIQGITSLYTLITGQRSKLTFVVDAVLGCVLWTVLCVSIIVSLEHPPIPFAAEISSAIASWWILVRYEVPKTVCEFKSISMHVRKDQTKNTNDRNISSA